MKGVICSVETVPFEDLCRTFVGNLMGVGLALRVALLVGLAWVSSMMLIPTNRLSTLARDIV